MERLDYANNIWLSLAGSELADAGGNGIAQACQRPTLRCDLGGEAWAFHRFTELGYFDRVKLSPLVPQYTPLSAEQNLIVGSGIKPAYI